MLSNESVRSESINNRGSLYWYRIGDVNHTGIINASDASTVLGAINTYCGSIYGSLPVSDANENISLYFPDVHYAEAADTNQLKEIDEWNTHGGVLDDWIVIDYEDAENILDFYSYLAVVYTPEQAQAAVIGDGNQCYEQVLLIEP